MEQQWMMRVKVKQAVCTLFKYHKQGICFMSCVTFSDTQMSFFPLHYTRSSSAVAYSTHEVRWRLDTAAGNGIHRREQHPSICYFNH